MRVVKFDAWWVFVPRMKAPSKDCLHPPASILILDPIRSPFTPNERRRFDLSGATAVCADDPLGLRSFSDSHVFSLFEVAIAVDAKVMLVKRQLNGQRNGQPNDDTSGGGDGNGGADSGGLGNGGAGAGGGAARAAVSFGDTVEIAKIVRESLVGGLLERIMRTSITMLNVSQNLVKTCSIIVWHFKLSPA